MHKSVFPLSLALLTVNASDAQQQAFEQRIVASDLADPWSISYGSDGYLWITESKTYRVCRIDPESGSMTTVLDLTDKRLFPRHDTLDTGGKPWPQGGLMGLALHPDFSSGKPFVYLAYVYKFEEAGNEGNGCLPDFGGCLFKTKVVRYRYEDHSKQLVNEEVIDDDIPGSNDHNGGRLIIMPAKGNHYLFYAVGDLGAGQYDNAGRPNFAQDPGTKEGKILRYLADADDSRQGPGAWIPDDNPFNADTLSPVYSIGHRNAQGLAWGNVNGATYLYASEHGPFSDDEINRIEPGKNYGHPLIIGYADGNYNGLAAGVSPHSHLPGPWNTSYPLIVSEQDAAAQLGEAYRDPIYSFMPSDNEYLLDKMKQIRASESPEWPSVAPSGLAFYHHEGKPEWKNSLLLTTLKAGALYRIPLRPDGEGLASEPEKLIEANVRYRDICIAPDGMKLFVITDKSAVTSGPTEEKPDESNMRGCIIEYRLVR
ncbi:PQQ-dependent sugar dehydrogenase [Parapedobacter deserti]|uniref:PQQ-dependent sugar dehydrogenase n=1 Tax=Parapedobacter deserti TaxID=1912957 RepID=A0ABV7JRV3_9SPHI